MSGQPARQARAHARPHADGATPWYIRALLGISAWLAAVLLLPLLGWLLHQSVGYSRFVTLAVAAGCCAVSVPLLRVRSGDFLQQCGAALSLAGLIFGIIEGSWPTLPHWLWIGGLAAVMYAAGPVVVHRYLCALVVLGAIVMVVLELTLPHADEGAAAVAVGGLAALYWLAQTWPRLSLRSRALEPMAIVFVLGSMVLAWNLHSGPAVWLCVAWPVGAWLFFSRTVSDADAAWHRYRMMLAVILLLLTPAWLAAPGLAIGLGWLIAGFALGRLVLLGSGGVGMLLYLAVYYYQLDTPLLYKAFWLGACGLVMTGFALLGTRLDKTFR